MIRCIAIDDEPRALEVTAQHAERIDYLQLEKRFTNPLEALAYLRDHTIDLLFLDVNMPDISGLELLGQLKRKPLVIFTTAHSEYALEGYEHAAVDFLLKPFTFARFLKAVEKVRDRMPDNSKDYFFVTSGNQKRRISVDEVLYLESRGNYVAYVLKDGEVEVRSTIKEALQQLPASQFQQVHRSFAVALRWIDRIEDNHVYIGKSAISIGASHRDAFLRRIS